MAVHPAENQLLAKVPTALAAALDVPNLAAESALRGAPDVDFVLSAIGQTFVIDLLTAPAAGKIAARAERLKHAAKDIHRPGIPLLVVPFMGEAGRRACESARVSWFDLSGNAHIVAPGLRVIIEGRPDLFPSRGRPASNFAPKSARVVRWLLMHPERSFTQREIARATEMSDGFVSRIIAGLDADGYLTRVRAAGDGDGGGDGGGYGHADGSGYGGGAGSGAGEADGSGHGGGWAEEDGSTARHRRSSQVRVRDAGLLLDAWRDEYQFSKHTIIKGHVAARSGNALARFVSDTFVTEQVEHAATGLAAAWQQTHFAAFRVATFFVTSSPPAALKEKLGFREDARGANLWLVVPNDVGVFHEAAGREGVRCVHPVQAYVDLKAHPERAAEAAERLRADLLKWNRND